MTSGPDLPERDPALERAWRAQSRETPPVELDRAILAAAHRAVGSGPRETSSSPEAKQPQRWWMPLAAAATIGAIAVGVLQLAPQDAGIVAPNERIAAVAPRQDVDRQAPAATAKVQSAASAPASPAPSAEIDRAVSKPPAPPPEAAVAAPPSAASTLPAEAARRVKEAGVTQAEGAAPAALARKSDLAPAPANGRTFAEKPFADAAVATAPSPQPPPSTSASAPQGAREAPVVVGKLEQRAPDPFPAAPAPRRIDAQDEKRSAPRASSDAAADAPPAPRAAPTPPSLSSAEQVARTTERKDAVAEAERQAAPAGAPPSAAGAASALATAPTGAGAPMRARENDAARNEPRTQAAPGAAPPPPLAKQTFASLADAKQKARDPDAWIARIRKLRDDGNTAEAIRELRAFREHVPDADRRIPPDLRDLANAARP